MARRSARNKAQRDRRGDFDENNEDGSLDQEHTGIQHRISDSDTSSFQPPSNQKPPKEDNSIERSEALSLSEGGGFCLSDDASSQKSSIGYRKERKGQTKNSANSDLDLSDQESSQTENSASSELDHPDHLSSVSSQGYQKKSKKRSLRRGKKSKGGEEDSLNEEGETNGMQNSVSETFNLFFETRNASSDLDLDVSNRTIGYGEIKSAADKLGEQLTEKEIQEMLDYASYTNNSQVNMSAFKKLMKKIRTG